MAFAQFAAKKHFQGIATTMIEDASDNPLMSESLAGFWVWAISIFLVGVMVGVTINRFIPSRMFGW